MCIKLSLPRHFRSHLVDWSVVVIPSAAAHKNLPSSIRNITSSAKLLLYRVSLSVCVTNWRHSFVRTRCIYTMLKEKGRKRKGKEATVFRVEHHLSIPPFLVTLLHTHLRHSHDSPSSKNHSGEASKLPFPSPHCTFNPTNQPASQPTDRPTHPSKRSILF